MASILCIKPSCIIVLASKAGSSKSVVVSLQLDEIASTLSLQSDTSQWSVIWPQSIQSMGKSELGLYLASITLDPGEHSLASICESAFLEEWHALDTIKLVIFSDAQLLMLLLWAEEHGIEKCGEFDVRLKTEAAGGYSKTYVAEQVVDRIASWDHPECTDSFALLGDHAGVLDLKRELDYFISKHTLARGQMLICTTVMSAFLQHAMAVEILNVWERMKGKITKMRYLVVICIGEGNPSASASMRLLLLPLTHGQPGKAPEHLGINLRFLVKGKPPPRIPRLSCARLLAILGNSTGLPELVTCKVTVTEGSSLLMLSAALSAIENHFVLEGKSLLSQKAIPSLIDALSNLCTDPKQTLQNELDRFGRSELTFALDVEPEIDDDVKLPEVQSGIWGSQSKEKLGVDQDNEAEGGSESSEVADTYES